MAKRGESQAVRRKKANRAAILALVTIGLVVGAGVIFSDFFSGFAEFKAKADSTLGMTRTEVFVLMGEPTRILSGSEYLSDHQSEIAATFAPEPPAVESDEVFEYRYANSLALLFIRGGSVFLVYAGAT